MHRSSSSGQIQPSGGATMQSHFDHSATAAAGHDDFFDQMLSAIPAAWSDLGNPTAFDAGDAKLFSTALAGKSADDAAADGGGIQYSPYIDESSMLASRLRQHQISGGGGSPGGKQLAALQLGHRQMIAGGGEPGLLPLPLSLGGDGDEAFKSPNSTGAVGLYGNEFAGALQRAAAQTAGQQQHFISSPQGSAMLAQNYGPASPGVTAGGGAAAPRQRVRARRGQATDPHSIAERLRRERIAERMKALQELVPNANKTDKASMLDEIIDYVKFLQLQVKVLSMSRLGGAAGVGPLMADISSEAGRAGGSATTAASSDGSMAVTEHQVAKLMEEDMGSAMQYLQGKGLCLMPISLASAISTATCHPRGGGIAAAVGGLLAATNAGRMMASAGNNNNGGEGPSSPSLSVLTVQSAMANGGGGDASSTTKEAASVSKP